MRRRTSAVPAICAQKWNRKQDARRRDCIYVGSNIQYNASELVAMYVSYIRGPVRLTCGTHFGLTKLPTSIVFIPASASLLMSSTLISVGMMDFSFWSPSRGPTSTIRTTDSDLEGSGEVGFVVTRHRRSTRVCEYEYGQRDLW